jgi:signal transduction histidine kinase
MATIPAARRWNAPRQLRLTRAGSAWIWLPSLVYALVLALNATAALTPPRLSLTLSVPATGHARVAWVMPGGALWDRGVRAGDAVLALNGRPPVREDAGPWTGRRLRVRTERGATVEVNAVTLPAGRATWPLLLLSPWFLLLATLVVLRAPQRAVGRAAYLLFASAAYALALAPGADADNVAATVAEWAATALFAAGFAHFFRVYPSSRGTSRLPAWLLVPPLAGVLLGVAALGWPALYTLADLARITALLAYLLLGVGLLIRSFITVREDGARRGLTIICAGTVVSILPFAALYLLPTILGRPTLAAAEQAILALALLPVAFTYAILRHNALDVHLLQRWLVHGLLWVALLAPLTAAVFVRHWILDAVPEPGRSVIFATALALLTGLSFGWARVRLQRALDRLIFKDSYDYRASLEGLSRDLSLAGDLDTLGARLPATLRRLMNLDFAALLVHDDARGVHVRGDAGIDKPALLPALVAAAADVRDEPRAVSLEYGYLTVLVVPLRTHDVLAGHLCLGPKSTGEPFRAEDRALLATLSGHLAAIVRNAHLVGDLRGQARTLDALNERLSRTQEEERARLAADLHDEPLQTALSLQRQIAIDGRDRATTARHIAISQTLIAQLRVLCTAMRPAALDHLGLHAALDQLARERGQRAGIPIMVDADPEIMELDVPAAAELVLYRAAQEALNNCLRHARPHTVRITYAARGTARNSSWLTTAWASPSPTISRISRGRGIWAWPACACVSITPAAHYTSPPRPARGPPCGSIFHSWRR